LKKSSFIVLLTRVQTVGFLVIAEHKAGGWHATDLAEGGSPSYHVAWMTSFGVPWGISSFCFVFGHDCGVAQADIFSFYYLFLNFVWIMMFYL
jgi:hypothetical protein